MTSSHADQERSREAAEWLIRLSCSTPSEEDVRAWSNWCESDPQNTEAFETLAALWRASKQYPPSAQAVTALLAPDGEPARIDGFWAKQRPWRNWGNPLRMKIAYALLAFGVLVAAALVLRLRLPGWHATQSESISSERAQQSAVVLEDGSRVDLGGRSAVEVDYTRKQRLLTLLSGEAYFQDKQITSWPFVVTAANVEVVAIGTAFDVEKSKDQVAVSVVDGTVDVSVHGRTAIASREAQGATAPNEGAVFRLKAGEKLAVSVTGLVHFYLIAKESAIAWREGRLEFFDASLSDVVESINRYAKRPLVIEDPSIASKRFTGTVFLSSIDEWIDSLPTVFRVTVDRSQPDVIALGR
ncbi:MAG TPA: FecR domain-containing protein [Steroidobacteraceae bacterium]|nr:FecR domain-containing protein [Steroidobacteraceae bacterium]